MTFRFITLSLLVTFLLTESVLSQSSNNPTASASTSASPAANTPPPAEPLPIEPGENRLPQKPDWEVDVTEKLVKDDGKTYAEVMDRKARATRVKGAMMEWDLKVSRPKEAAPNWPIVLEADETRVIRQTTCNNTNLTWNQEFTGGLWLSGEGSVLLPLPADSSPIAIHLEVMDLPLAYPNDFGRLRLRPATLDEVLHFDRNQSGSKITLHNLSNLPQEVSWHARHESYFGEPLGQADDSATINPGESIDINTLVPITDDLYKSRYWATVGRRVTSQYWQYAPDCKSLYAREPNIGLPMHGWEWVFVPGPLLDNRPPDQGWKLADGNSINPSKADYKSHWMWVRNKFKVPTDWPTMQKIMLSLNNGVSFRALVMIDNQKIGEYSVWELPKVLDITDLVKPGTEHTICIGVTDYIVALSPKVKPPEVGSMPPPNRGMAYPISAAFDGDLKIGFNMKLRLYSVPTLRTDWVQVQTFVQSNKRVESLFEVHNDDILSAAATLHAIVLDAGKVVLDLGKVPVNVESNSTQTVNLSKPWAAAELWSLDHPKLYELRTELLDRNGTVVDLRRERFGFREFGIKGPHFTLNGQPINLIGGSHVIINNFTWPLRGHPYRIIRFDRENDNLNVADEAGYLMKDEIGGICSWCADNYDWQSGTLFPGLKERAIGQIRSNINHPSAFMWDLANEVTYRGPGEADQMGLLFQDLRKIDPSREVTIGGSKPFPTGADVLDYHGWGDWRNRTDYFFMHPEERPSYLKTGGYFIHRPENEPVKDWITDTAEVGSPQALFPGTARDLREVGNHPTLFSEGVYMEDIETFPLFGHDTYIPLPQSGRSDFWSVMGPFRELSLLGCRRIAVQNVRQAQVAGSMIHVSGGPGRYILPLASFSWDRKFRFFAGDTLKTRFGIHYDLTVPAKVHAHYRLLDGDQVVGEKTVALDMEPSDLRFVDLEWPLPASAADKTLNLEVRVSPEVGTGEFYDNVPITSYAPVTPHLPAGINLSVYDPQAGISKYLDGWKVSYQHLTKLSEWKPEASVLLAGPEALTGTSSDDLANLAKNIQSGGRVIVLQHMSLPQFLPHNLIQDREAISYTARLDCPSPITDGLNTEDFRAWTTRENDQVVAWNSLETPSTGQFRAHLNGGRASPVLEVGQGAGRVLFVQLNLKDALGYEPAATRVMANLLNWTASPSPFSPVPTILVATDNAFSSAMQSRYGLTSPLIQKPSNTDVKKASLIILSGTDVGARAELDKVKDALTTSLNGGATLFVYGLDKDGATWLSGIANQPLQLDSYPARYGYVTHPENSLIAGLGHGDFFIGGIGKGVNVNKPTQETTDLTGEFTLNGPSVLQLTRPGFLADIPTGKGHIVVDLVKSIDSAQPCMTRIMSVLLGNAGAQLDPDGANVVDKTVWAFQTIDLKKFVNRSLRDSDDPTKKRGWNSSGEDNDLRDFLTGKQNLHGVDYLITPPDEADGNSLIMIAGKNAKLGGPTEVKGIPVNAKADRLYFLHNSAWGIPEFTYRIYYKEDRAVWIPGKADPFVDVVVHADQNITEWIAGGACYRNERFLSGATVAWVGGTKATRSGSTLGDQAVGVYQMVWDNPHPEKTIESIDILSPGIEGGGNAFIFGITAATRDTSKSYNSEQSSNPAPPLDKVLPANIDRVDIQSQVDFPNYGFVLMKTGEIAAIYDRNGKTFAAGVGWKASSFHDQPGSPRDEQSLGSQDASAATIVETKQGNRRLFEIKGDGDNANWTITLTATPASVRYEINFTPKTNPPDGQTARMTTGLTFINGAEAQVNVNQNPIPIKTPSGPASLVFDQDHTRWVFNYELYKGGVIFKSPCMDTGTYAAGAKQYLWWELTPP